MATTKKVKWSAVDQLLLALYEARPVGRSKTAQAMAIRLRYVTRQEGSEFEGILMLTPEGRARAKAVQHSAQAARAASPDAKDLVSLAEQERIMAAREQSARVDTNPFNADPRVVAARVTLCRLQDDAVMALAALSAAQETYTALAVRVALAKRTLEELEANGGHSGA